MDRCALSRDRGGGLCRWRQLGRTRRGSYFRLRWEDFLVQDAFHFRLEGWKQQIGSAHVVQGQLVDVSGVEMTAAIAPSRATSLQAEIDGIAQTSLPPSRARKFGGKLSSANVGM